MTQATLFEDGATEPGPFGHRRYIPILLTREGERLAVEHTDDDTRSAMTPLFVVHPIDRHPDTGVPRKTLAEHLTSLVGDLAKNWGTRPAFVDLRHVDTTAPPNSGIHPLHWFLRYAWRHHVHLTPVISGTAHPPTYRTAAVRAANELGTSLMLRLDPDECCALGTTAGDGLLGTLIAETERPISELHLMLDFEDQPGASLTTVVTACDRALRSLRKNATWASVTVAATGMPVTTSSIGRDTSAHLQRTEWALWQHLTASDYRRPSFGDYAVQHPHPVSGFDPRYMDSSAQLRYTTPTGWLVVRGRGLQKVGFAQIRRLAGDIVASPDYCGAAFSSGDNWLMRCANHETTTGGQRVWRTVTTNHHLTYVVRQIASLAGI